MFFTRTPASEKLVAKSKDIVSAFTEIIDQLVVVNNSIDQEQKSIQDQIDLLLAQNTDLETTKGLNTKVMENVKKILE